MARKRRAKQAQPEGERPLPSVWLKAVYHVHVFHYRMPETAAIAALTSFVPSPLTVKMAMMASLLQRGDDQKAKQLTAHLPQMEVRVAPPTAAFSFKAFLRYRSVPAVESAGEMDEAGSFYPSRPHTREYALFADEIVIYVGLPESAINIKEIAEEALRHIRCLGCKDSLVWCKSVSEIAPAEVEREATVSQLKEGEAGNVVLLADFATNAPIKSLQEIVPGQRKKEHYRCIPFVLPGRITTKGQTRLFLKKQRNGT